MDRSLGIAGIQMEVVYGKDNSEAMLKKLDAVMTLFPWVDIILFSELCVSGLDTGQAAPMPNQFLDKFRQWARKEKKWLIPGSFYEKDKNRIYNTAVVISPDGGIVTKYRKIFPWRPIEQGDPGKEFCIFDIPGKGRFGVCSVTMFGFRRWLATWPGWGRKLFFVPRQPTPRTEPRR